MDGVRERGWDLLDLLALLAAAIIDEPNFVLIWDIRVEYINN